MLLAPENVKNVRILYKSPLNRVETIWETGRILQTVHISKKIPGQALGKSFVHVEGGEMLSGGRRRYLTCRTQTKGLSSTCTRKVENSFALDYEQSPIFPQRQQSMRNASARENHPTREKETRGWEGLFVVYFRVKSVAKSYRRVGRVILVYSANIYSCSKFSRFRAKVTFSRLVI